ncbi:hypothetical protein L207DRAFT_507281 [Hyaloscypha variabilis F]|uniref:Nephrocystin 3-like N-terminal domain-containing protein n=1 Tax=Hyaloscypha variabilis (strain UAMH 11265 / GT02V1 / F) TaxID=1149755 RepID=A0A2J6S6H4_HYAVF|nr:hypothetical protein L207DRAFT_507281 [Hyaloscypha variabilis F]
MEHEASSSKQKLRVSDIGLSVLHDPPDAIADIVFVHGLQGHPRKTWTCENRPVGPQGSREAADRGIKKLFSRRHKGSSRDGEKTEEYSVFWPLDLLPQECANARILTWGYDSKVSHFFGGATNQSNIAANARNLLYALNRGRQECVGRKLIFVAHSLGGIIVKDVFYRAAIEDKSPVHDIFVSTVAILFLGTPHRGSDKAGIGEIVRRIASASGFDTTDHHLRALQINSPELERIHELFMKLYDERERHFKVLTFQEAKGIIGINYLKMNERVVEPFSSSINNEPKHTINANHMSMCRFANRDDEGYLQVSGELQILLVEIDKKNQDVLEKDREGANLETASESQMTTSSTVPSLNDVERKCVAVLAQNTSSASEYKFALPQPVEGTCQWILSNVQYREWYLRKETCLLWISGYPGSGKTTLSAYLLDYLSAGELSPSSRTTLCYFFCDDKIDTQRDGLSILRSLIHQLLVRRRLLIKYVKAAYNYAGPEFDQKFGQLWQIFIAIASDKRVGPISVIVDAIDECEETTRKRFLDDVQKLLHQPRSTKSKTPCIKFLFTSRPLFVRGYTTNLLQLDPSKDYVEQDLGLVIRTKVDGIVRRNQCKPDVKPYLETALYSKADRTFLWVTLVLHLLEESLRATRKDFKLIIDALPETLTETYQQFLYGIPKKSQQFARKLLHFLVGSSRPLALKEMRVLEAINHDHHTLAALEEDAQPYIQGVIEGVLGPLIRIWDSRIYLVHQSLKEYLITLSTEIENPLSGLYGVDPCNASLCLAEACVRYLLLDDFKQDLFATGQASTTDSPLSPLADSPILNSSTEADEIGAIENLWDALDLGEDTMFKDPTAFETEVCDTIGTLYTLFDYSARHWAEHFSAACSVSPPELLESALILSDTTSARGSNWFRYYWLHTEANLPGPQDFFPLLTASYFGHPVSVKSLLSQSSHRSDIAESSMYWAARMGHLDVVDLLLRDEVNPDIKVVDGMNALIAAVQFDHFDVVKRLLVDEGFISERDGYRVNYSPIGGRTPLSIAAGNGLVRVVRELLRHHRIHPDLPDFDQWTPLFWSIGGKNLDVLQSLVTDPRVDVNHLDRSGRNILSWAASAGELELVRYLISLPNLNADEADRAGRTAFSWAAGEGHLEVVLLLRRSRRIDISRKDNNGRNAISWASSGGHHKVVGYLIKHDRRGVDEEDVDGWTPLAWALFNRTPKTVQILIDSGLVNVNKKDIMGRSALAFAAGYGYLDVVQILLKTVGIDVESKDNDGRTPLSAASRYPEIVELLQNFKN